MLVPGHPGEHVFLGGVHGDHRGENDEQGAGILVAGGYATLVHPRADGWGDVGTETFGDPGAEPDTTAPTLQVALIPKAGTTLVLAFNEAVKFGAGGNGGFALTMSGGAVTATYASGTTTTVLTYTLSRTVAAAETGTITYTQPGNGVEDIAGNDLASIGATSVIRGGSGSNRFNSFNNFLLGF